MPTVVVDGAEIAYTSHGNGPGLILLHGTGGAGVSTWTPLLRRLASHRTVVVPDLRGSGATRDGDEPLSLDTLADDVLAVASDARLDEFDLCGFSLGGAVAVSASAAAPTRIRSLVVIAAARSWCDSRTRLQFELWKDLHAADARLFARYWLLVGLSPDFVAAIPSDELDRAASFPIEPGLERQSTLSTQIDLTGCLPSVRARTLVIGCLHDTIVPPQKARELADGIEDAKYLELSAGHLVILEAPGILADRILSHMTDG